jgi:endonuclease/exonuclease/phosphatase family metal-dependent hydrolase
VRTVVGAPVWARFLEELQLQMEDWLDIRVRHPDAPLIVAGDFNQSLDGSGWYESEKTLASLRGALRHVGLECLTTEDVVAGGKLRCNHLIDHVCVSEPLVAMGEVSCWEPTRADGVVLSDHPGVAVALTDG